MLLLINLDATHVNDIIPSISNNNESPESKVGTFSFCSHIEVTAKRKQIRVLFRDLT